MKLSDSERQSLARMERLVETKDPVFAARMMWPQHSRAGQWAALARRPGIHGRWRGLMLCLMVLLVPLAVTVLVLGGVVLGVWAVVVGGAVLLLQAAAAVRWRLARSRSRDWVEGSW